MLGLTRPQPPPLRDWIRCSLLGIGIGVVVLGIGGRVSMRGIAVLAGAPGSFSLGGSVTVVFLGAVAGLGGALILMVLRTLLPRRWLIQTLWFYAILILVALRGLRPLDWPRVFLFLPLVLVFGFLMRTLSRRYRRVSTAPAGQVLPLGGTRGV
jgi:hypothetical protein